VRHFAGSQGVSLGGARRLIGLKLPEKLILSRPLIFVGANHMAWLNFVIMNHRSLKLVLLLALLIPQTVAAVGPRCECFPTEKLPADLRVKSEALLLKALDSEALYTIIGGLKPMSSGFASFKFSVERPDLTQIEETRKLLSAWRCGEELYADVQHFAAIYDDEKTKEKTRFADAIVFNRPALAGKIGQYPGFFAPYGITPSAHPMEVLMTIEHSQQDLRWRGLGHLFGFPLYAVDFFVAAGEDQQRTGKFVERDFYSIPTFVADERHFVWAVPKGHEEREEDRVIKARAAKILESYKKRRAKYIGDGKQGVVKLLREWFDDGKGVCSSLNPRW
jgi:hypothetical protein